MNNQLDQNYNEITLIINDKVIHNYTYKVKYNAPRKVEITEISLHIPGINCT